MWKATWKRYKKKRKVGIKAAATGGVNSSKAASLAVEERRDRAHRVGAEKKLTKGEQKKQTSSSCYAACI